MSRYENIRIFQDTRSRYEQDEMLRQAVENSVRTQWMIAEGDSLPQVQPLYDESAEVIVSKKRTYEAASAYKGQSVCVLNFASSVSLGGGVVSGATAQEECLCRCSTLYPCLNVPLMHEMFYLPHRKKRNPLHDDDCIYTPGVVVFKTDAKMPEMMDEADWYKVNVLTCAAPNLRGIPANPYNPDEGDVPAVITADELYALHERRTRRILDIAAWKGDEVVILGAFGCGAFLNDPRIVSRAMMSAAWEYRHMFKTIEFAVYCSDWEMQNYRIFCEALHNKLAEKGK